MPKNILHLTFCPAQKSPAAEYGRCSYLTFNLLLEPHEAAGSQISEVKSPRSRLDRFQPVWGSWDQLMSGVKLWQIQEAAASLLTMSAAAWMLQFGRFFFPELNNISSLKSEQRATLKASLYFWLALGLIKHRFALQLAMGRWRMPTLAPCTNQRHWYNQFPLKCFFWQSAFYVQMSSRSPMDMRNKCNGFGNIPSGLSGFYREPTVVH